MQRLWRRLFRRPTPRQTLFRQPANRSLQRKALAVIGTICLLTLFNVCSSLWFAWVTENDAAAINIAGSLRMQSWRLTEQVLIPELTSQEALGRLIDIYDNSINSPPLKKLAEDYDTLGDSYRLVLYEWNNEMKPLLGSPQGYTLFIEQVPDFVDRIDRMVQALQHNTESKLQQLFVIALLTLVGILSLAVITVRFIRSHILHPIRELSDAATNVRNGDFQSIALTYDADNEMGWFTQTFNLMAADLAQSYDSLESEVAEQTRALAQSNSALQLLYKASRNIADNPYNSEQVSDMLDSWKSLLRLDSCYICLSASADTSRLQKITTDREADDCSNNNCNKCLSDNCAPFVQQDLQTCSFELQSEQQSFGFLKVTSSLASGLSEESRQWLQTFADIVATSLYQSSSKTQQQKLLLMEERAVIARELHDSLAQALSYQKIQISRLKRRLKKDGSLEPVDAILAELQDGISSAYIQLRELLRTFRLTLPEGDLETALKQTLDEYRQREPDIEFSLDYQLRYCNIDAHQQIHALQIVREALVNVIKHSQATQARVCCFQQDNSAITITVEDNGRGLDLQQQKSGHYGTTIMRERAASMDGEFAMQSSAEGGVHVILTFSPDLKSEKL
ncbi:histidine kinase [Endozoicomonadaceae bacterium StTr2]